MGLNGVRNQSKLNRIAALVGRPVLIAYSRYFKNQNDLLAFTREDEAIMVNLKNGTAEPYTDERVELWRAQDGDFGGIRRKPQAINEDDGA